MSNPNASSQETTLWQGTPSPLVKLPVFLAIAMGSIVLTIVLLLVRAGMSAPTVVGDPDPRGFIPWVILADWVIALLVAVGLYMSVRTTRYHVTTERIRITTGLLSTTTDDLELRRVRDMSVQRPFLLRLFGLGNIVLATTDASTPQCVLQAVPKPDELQSAIRQQVQGFYTRRAVTDIEIG